MLWGQGLGQGGHLAKLPGLQEFRFVLKSKSSLQKPEPAVKTE